MEENSLTWEEGKNGGNIEQFKLNFVAENGVIPYYAIKNDS